MTESKICTCPSGDGSLRWPCPAHPAEQAGGDERAAFEAAFAAMGRPVCRADYDHAAYGTPFDDGGWTGWQARAALAQPSLDHAVQAHDIPMLIASEHANPDYAMGWNDCRAKIIGASSAVQAEQAEAERPEVVGYRSNETGMVYEQDYGLENPEALTTVAECDRIVGALRDELEAERKRVNIYVNNNRIRQDNERLRAELRDALARVAEMEACGTPALLAAADYFAERAKGPSPGWVTLSAVAKELRVRADKAPVAEAQHSVPEGWMLVECGIWTQEQVDEMQKTVTRFRNSEFVDDRALAMAVADAGQCKAPEISLAELLATAPGKEVPQAWLDVQAERRRQITAEGWTPEHDDEHADGQMAQAAGCYALHAGGIGTDWPDGLQNGSALFWPWDKDWWKPTTPRRDLVKACALALAEIERLDRAAPGKEVGHE